MSRNKKGYDIITFFISCNIMGGLGASLVPVALDVYGITDLSKLFTVSLIIGSIGGLIAAVAISKFVPIGEKTVLYGLFSGTFLVAWTNLTVVVASIQSHIQFTGFPLHALVLLLGSVIFIFTLYSMGGMDIEN